MIRAISSDKKMICALLVSSFSDNPSVNDIVDGRRRWADRMVGLMEYAFELCMRCGEVWLSDDRRGCALLLFPHERRTTLYTVWLDVKLALGVVGISRLARVLRRDRLVRDLHPGQDKAYLWFIGVKPLHQKTGLGSALLSELISRYDSLGLPLYLETSMPGNLAWYRRFGFKQYDQLELGYRLFFLFRTV